MLIDQSTKRYFFNFGAVSGRCRHNHRTLLGLARCQQRESKRCKNQGAYSDREAWIHNDRGEISRLTAELANCYALLLG